MKKIIIAASLLFILTGCASHYSKPATNTGEAGEIVVYKNRCEYFLVDTLMGVAILEYYEGNNPNEGDIIVGDFRSYGVKEMYNRTVDAKLRVYVEDYGLSEKEAREEYSKKCPPKEKTVAQK